jgi:LysM repeat protein
MKHLLSILAALLYVLNISNAQTVKNEIRTIGGKKYIIYTIKAGETWASIAEKSGITERSLIDANKQANGSLKNVVTVIVPTEKSSKNLLNDSTINVEANANEVKIFGKEIRTETKGNRTLTIYKTGNGDNIIMLAKYFNTSVIEIQKQNNLVKNKLLPGKILKIYSGNIEASNTEIKDTLTLKMEKNVEQENTIETKKIVKKLNNKTQINKTTATKSELTKKNDSSTPLTEKSAIDITKEKNVNELRSNSGKNKAVSTHYVLAGETIERIAKKYKISVSDIANWNNLVKNKIKVGQELIVSSKSEDNSYVPLISLDSKSDKQIKNSDKSGSFRYVEEKGLCLTTDENFIGIAHRNAPVGTLLLLTSTENYKKIYVRVTSILVNSNEDIIIQVDNETATELAFNSNLTNVLLSYSIIE